MKQLFLLLFAAMMSLTASAQDIYNEVRALQKKYQTFSEDTTKNIDERKIAVFKSDALYYLTEKAGQTDGFTEYQLGEQVDALIDFVNIYIKRISAARKPNDQQVIMAKFRGYTTDHALFNDMEKEITYAYVDNDNFLTQFSLDTNWVEALKEARK